MPEIDAPFRTQMLAEADALYRLARRLTRDPTRAEDLVQETYVRAMRGSTGFTQQGFGIKPWLLRILYNVHLNSAQREKRQPTALAEDSLEAGSPEQPTVLPIDPSSFQAMDQRLVHALDDLPEHYRVILLLWAVEELSYKEIAAALDVPIGTVMSRLYRARERLATTLRPLALEEGIVRE